MYFSVKSTYPTRIIFTNSHDRVPCSKQSLVSGTFYGKIICNMEKYSEKDSGTLILAKLIFSVIRLNVTEVAREHEISRLILQLLGVAKHTYNSGLKREIHRERCGSGACRNCCLSAAVAGILNTNRKANNKKYLETDAQTRHGQDWFVDKTKFCRLLLTWNCRRHSGLLVFLPTLEEKFMNFLLIFSIQKISTRFIFNKRYFYCYIGQSKGPNLKLCCNL